MPPDPLTDLNRRLDATGTHLARLEAYYRGQQPLAYLAPEVKATVGNRLQPLVLNWPRLVVGAVEERLDVTGFRTGPDEPADDEAWRLWAANRLDHQAALAHVEALVAGRAFATVWAGTDASTPRITVESARQMAVQRDPASGTITAALKRWNEDGRARAVLFEADRIRRLVSGANVPEGGTVPTDGWETVETIDNPLGVVPVVALVNRPGLLATDGESELADVVPIADAVNKLATDMMVASEFAAMPRRWATGIELPEDDEGNPNTSAAFNMTAGRVWWAEDPATSFGQFPEARLDAFVSALNLLTTTLAALSGLPPHYLGLHGDQPASADAIRSSEASLVAKARRRQRTFGGAWEQVMGLAFMVRDGRPSDTRLETMWADAETRTVAQAADAAAKLVEAGILPVEQAWDDLGYTPAQQDRMRGQRRRDTLDTAAVDLDRLVSQ